MQLLANTLVITGAAILAVALFPLARLIRALAQGATRTSWLTMAGLILFFIAGYLFFLRENWQNCQQVTDLLVPGVFFCGAIFVFWVCLLSLRTAQDLQRICVLELESNTDPLLGIHNRRYLDRRLSDEVSRARRYSLPLALLMIDVDHFKKVNDTFGHQLGDQVLIKTAGLIANSIREVDVVARYGGEELVVILPSTPAANAAILAERLRQAVETQIIIPSAPGGPDIRITISIGIAGLSQEITTPATLLEGADAAMYRAKSTGRNRVESAA
ncbi:MAG: GGDEF domain-containing protein [Desulfobulbaceae bacterium]|nr:GGDEF domain-containing protein [Desulfobulbaceae bacterium]